MAVMTQRPLPDLGTLGRATVGQDSFDRSLINLSSVRRVDQSALEILFTASQVALYEFQGKSQSKSWVSFPGV